MGNQNGIPAFNNKEMGEVIFFPTDIIVNKNQVSTTETKKV